MQILVLKRKSKTKRLYSLQKPVRNQVVNHFLIHTRNDPPRTIVFYEIYSSEEAFQKHKAFAYAKRFFEFLKGRIENDMPEVVFLTALDS